MAHMLVAPDKFKGTVSAAGVASAMAAAASDAGWSVTTLPMADGGEGILQALGGRERHSRVPGPLGTMVDAEWRLDHGVAVIEMAQASGLALVGGPQNNDAMAATTGGTGALIAAAVAAGARRVIVGAGGSATTDGGLGAVLALRPHARLAGIRIEVACDVRTGFVEAAETFAAQKGASPAEVSLLRRRLESLVDMYRREYGVDVSDLPGAGAAGGLAGGLAALGATLVPGFELVAEAVGLADEIDKADLVVTGEGLLDDQSFNGKVVGGVTSMARRAGIDCLVVVGEVLGGTDAPEYFASLDGPAALDGPAIGSSVVSLADR
ncbi:MAG: glycerate kinase, partial [Acidimicrobiales bacterium]